MMKNILTLSAALAVFTCSFANAASISVVPNAPGNFSIWLDGEGDVFDSIGVEILPQAGSALQNPDSGFEGFRPRDPGEAFSFINPFLAALPSQGGQGFSLLNIASDGDKITFEGGPLGSNIDTTGSPGGLFLVNVILPVGEVGSYSVRLVGGGVDLASLNGPIPIPEPTSLMLVGLGLVGFVARRRS